MTPATTWRQPTGPTAASRQEPASSPKARAWISSCGGPRRGVAAPSGAWRAGEWGDQLAEAPGRGGRRRLKVVVMVFNLRRGGVPDGALGVHIGLISNLRPIHHAWANPA